MAIQARRNLYGWHAAHKVYLNGRQTMLPQHPSQEMPEPLQKAILKPLGIK
jgi:hypothetical protein